MLLLSMRAIYSWSCEDLCSAATISSSSSSSSNSSRHNTRPTRPTAARACNPRPQFAESDRLLGLRETEFGDPLAVGAELIIARQSVCLCKTGTSASQLSLLLLSFSSARIFGSTSNAEKRKLGRRIFLARFWRPLFEHSATAFNASTDDWSVLAFLHAVKDRNIFRPIRMEFRARRGASPFLVNS